MFLLELFDVTKNELEMGFAGLHGRGRIKQDPAIERELYLTLEEVYKGCTKKMKISRRVSRDLENSKVLRREQFIECLLYGGKRF